MDLITVWRDLTVGQGVVVAAAAWLIPWLIGRLIDVVRELLGKPAPVDHCSHCEEVDALTEHMHQLVTLADDRNTVLGEIRDSTGRTAAAIDDLAAEFNAGRTGYHGWAMLNRILQEQR